MVNPFQGLAWLHSPHLIVWHRLLAAIVQSLYGHRSVCGGNVTNWRYCQLVIWYGPNVGVIFIFFKRFLSRRLALYVYEYLLHIGAQKSAQTFLSEVRAILLSRSSGIFYIPSSPNIE